MSRTNNMGDFSCRWLLPVLLLNVFVSTGLQEHLITRTEQPQTEQLRGITVPAASTCVFLVFTAPAAAAEERQLPHYFPHFPELCVHSLAAFNQLLPSNNLLRFYGKAAPEALDGWPV